MTGEIHDARDRFGKGVQPEDQEGISPEEAAAERRESLRQEVEPLRARLNARERLDPPDRMILARNLGRVIERDNPDQPTRTASQLFRSIYEGEVLISKEKKRKRYIRFDGEESEAEGHAGVLAATGKDFLTLAEGLAMLLGGSEPEDIAKDKMLRFVCNGASFHGPSRPLLLRDVDAHAILRKVGEALVDKIAKQTDLVRYSHELGDRNEVGGFEAFRVDMPLDPEPDLPSIPLARICVPRKVLCLPAFVPTDELNRDLTAAERREAFRVHGPLEGPDDAADPLPERSIQNIRARRQHQLWRQAIHDAGFDPDNMDWASFEDPGDGTALKGAFWETFWQTINVRLHLVADGTPGALTLGISALGTFLGHADWIEDSQFLKELEDDGFPESEVENCVVFDEDQDIVPWFPAGDRSYVCRGYYHWPSASGSNEGGNFEEPLPDFIPDWREQAVWPLLSEGAWRLLSSKMVEWPEMHHSVSARRSLSEPIGSSEMHEGYAVERTKEPDGVPSLRPLFDAPEKWTPALAGSLADAILRGLAYGEGEDRLDNRLIAKINKCVQSHEDQKRINLTAFEDALRAKDLAPNEQGTSIVAEGEG